jgi:diacylglycerol kinase (ATP)
VPAAQHPFIIVNPIAGDGRAGRLRPWLISQLPRHHDTALAVTTARGDAEELAREAIAAGHDRVIAVGGDGTMQEVVNGLVAAGGGTLGVVPCGRGNDLARSLHIPLDHEAALAIALGEVTTPMDVGRAWRLAVADLPASEPRAFVAAGGVGFDAQVAWAMAGPRPFWQKGRAGYFLGTLAELRRFHNQRLRITLDLADGPQVVEQTALMAAFANGPFYGGGMRICPDATLTDGQLDVCIVGDLSRTEAMRELPGIYEAKHVRNPHVAFYRARALTIESEETTRIHLDGEPFGSLPLRAEAVPAAINTAVPA